MLLTRLGVPKRWGDDPERLWRAMRWFIGPITTGLLAPGSWSYGVDRVPARGGAVLAMNHLSGIDPPLVGAFCARTVHYLAKAELLAIPVWGELLQWTGAFPVRRGERDEAALARARELVREGHVVGIYLEGTRQRFGYPGPPRSGGMLVAIEEGVPVVPCGSNPSGGATGTAAPAVSSGASRSVSTASPRSEQGYRAAAEHVGAEVRRLWCQAAEAVAAGFPERLPDGTPRHARIPPGWRHPRDTQVSLPASVF